MVGVGGDDASGSGGGDGGGQGQGQAAAKAFGVDNIAGSPCWMAPEPEVISGSPADFKADVWSLGIGQIQKPTQQQCQPEREPSAARQWHRACAAFDVLIASCCVGMCCCCCFFFSVPRAGKRWSRATRRLRNSLPHHVRDQAGSRSDAGLGPVLGAAPGRHGHGAPPGHVDVAQRHSGGQA